METSTAKILLASKGQIVGLRVLCDICPKFSLLLGFWIGKKLVVERRYDPVMRQFARYIGVDYSGTETPSSSLPGLRIFATGTDGAPEEINPPPSPRKYWTDANGRAN